MAETTATAIICPKCRHVRTAADVAPAWQCPACGIAYNKYQSYLERARKIATPPSAGDVAPDWTEDGSVWSLIAANVLSLVIAFYQDWSTVSLMTIYWAQSVIIGIANVFRMLTLDRFSTENFTMNDRRVEPTTATKIQVALFFTVHYGFFHLIYLVFLVAFMSDKRLSGTSTEEVLFEPWFWVCIAAFALNHFWSYRYNHDMDRQGTPNIGTLMFTPYLRIMPMHLTFIFGGMFMHTGGSLMLFGVLKTLADVGMHAVEHAQLKKVRGGTAGTH